MENNKTHSKEDAKKLANEILQLVDNKSYQTIYDAIDLVKIQIRQKSTFALTKTT